MLVDELLDHFDSPGHPNIRQPYQSGVGNSAQVNKLPEVLVQSDEDPVLRLCQLKQSPISRIRVEPLRLSNIVSVAAQPLRQSASGASVYQEPHGSETETAASVSPDMTVWA